MSLGERVLSGLRTIVMIEERTKLLDDALKAMKTQVDRQIADHEKRLIRLETIIEIARPDGAVLRIARDESSRSPG